MDNSIIACFDVYYHEEYGNASCIVFKKGNEEIISKYTNKIKNVDDYISGEFYKRELPCILKVLKEVKENIDIIIVDGFALINKDKKGLGGHLYDSIKHKIPVIGVAKSYLKGSASYLEIYRGKSSNPLYISAIGIDLYYSAKLIKSLKGNYRIPDILKEVDRLSRGLEIM